MSLSLRQARTFLDPLKGKTTTFVLRDRSTNLAFARQVIALSTLAGDSTAVLDLDAMYSSNSDSIFQDIPAPRDDAYSIRVPQPGSDIEKEFSELLGENSSIAVVDSLNSLYHLLASGSSKSRSRKLSFATNVLRYLARSADKTAILTMYRREGFGRTGTGRSMSALSDATASVEKKADELLLSCERGVLWPEGRFSIRIP